MCSVCEETAQVCNYPEGPLKPGPKLGTNYYPLTLASTCCININCILGSLQRPRKRQRSNNKQEESPVSFPPINHPGSADSGDREKGSTATPPTRQRLMAEEDLEEQGQGVGCSEASPHGDALGTRVKRSEQVNIQDLSFILHPSHENSSPDQEPQTVVVRPIGRESGLLQKLSSNLGLPQADIKSL